MIRWVVAVAALVGVWLALWEDLSAANVVSGTVLAVALLLLFRMPKASRRGALRPLAAIHFLGYFAWKLLEASAVVAWEVATPTNDINEGIVAVPIRGYSPLLVTAVANAISLTPGTLTIEVDEGPPVLYVHVLHLRDIEAVRRDVRRLETLLIRAFANAEAVAALETEEVRP